MHFDREALQGIFNALPIEDRYAVLDRIPDLYDRHLSSEERVEKIKAVMIQMGYIIPFEQPKMDWAVKEYDEAMAGMELIMEGRG